MESENSKRKSSVSPMTLKTTTNKKDDDAETAGLRCVISTMNTAIHEAAIAGKVMKDMHVKGLLNQMLAILEGLLKNRRSSDVRSATKKPKVTDSPEAPMRVDASSVMELTPHWWESEETREKERQKTMLKKPKVVKTKKKYSRSVYDIGASCPETGVESAADTYAEVKQVLASPED